MSQEGKQNNQIAQLQAQARRTERVRDLHAELYAEASKNRGKSEPMYRALDIACNALVSWEERGDQSQKVIEELSRRVAQEQQANQALSKEVQDLTAKLNPPAANEVVETATTLVLPAPGASEAAAA